MKPNKIYYDLNKSTYVYFNNFIINGKNYNVYFYFSSPIYLQKFKIKVKSYSKRQTEIFKSKYHININDDLYLLYYISFYEYLEKRGFLIKINDIYYNSIDSVSI